VIGVHGNRIFVIGQCKRTSCGNSGSRRKRNPAFHRKVLPLVAVKDNAVIAAVRNQIDQRIYLLGSLPGFGENLGIDLMVKPDRELVVI
jgi:hypothetical protein